MNPPDLDRSLSLAATLSLIALGVLWLAAPPDPALSPRKGAEDPPLLTLVLEPPSRADPAPGPATASKPSYQAGFRAPATPAARAGATAPLATVEGPKAAAGAVGPADDGWHDRSATPDGSPGAGALFEPSFMGPRPRRPEPGARHVVLDLQDRSVMGRLSDMARTATCSDLARALRESPSSSLAVLESMKRAGCGAR